MLDLVLDPRLKPALAEAFLREARRSGVPLADLELISYDARAVKEFLLASRERRVSAFLLTLDREGLESARRMTEAPAAPPSPEQARGLVR